MSELHASPAARPATSEANRVTDFRLDRIDESIRLMMAKIDAQNAESTGNLLKLDHIQTILSAIQLPGKSDACQRHADEMTDMAERMDKFETKTDELAKDVSKINTRLAYLGGGLAMLQLGLTFGPTIFHLLKTASTVAKIP